MTTNLADRYTQPPETRANHPCPACGYCPTCGRRGYTTYPFWPTYQPYWYWDPGVSHPFYGQDTITFNTSGNY